jgi:hypothetical protein
VKVKEMSERLSKNIMILAEEIYKNNVGTLGSDHVDIYSNAYTMGYNEAWNKYGNKKKLLNCKPTDYVINCSAIDMFVKHRDRFQNDIRNTHDAFMFGFLHEYMMCWNSIQNVNS